MDLELLLMISVPAAFVVFGLGWIAARVDIRQLVESSRSLPRSYFRGLNFLLNEEPDRAIDSFIEAVQLDPDTVELHFTLGGMFRTRGETDRAIRIHESLLARSDLTVEQRDRASLELANDFFKAGMLDRAESGFVALIGSKSCSAEALQSLMEVYEIEKEWKRAIDTAHALEAGSGRSLASRIAQFHCELAQTSLGHSRFDEAERHLKSARDADRNNVRAAILQGELEMERGQPQRAIECWLTIEKLSVLHMALIGPRLMQAYRDAGRAEEGLRLLRSVLAQSPSIDLLDLIYTETLAQQGAEAAHAIVLEELRRSPTLIGLDKLVEARAALVPPELSSELDLVKGLLHQETRKLSRYTCGQCGFRAHRFYWQCPGCRHWNTYVPRRVEELEVIR
ncbi:lipopolysaccharide assembly protein LapB [soil metagenome]